MPEYLAPGVYVEETSFRSKSIEGVSTTTTGFIGPTRYGPIDMEPDIITGLGEFERTYGDREQLVYDGDPMHNFMWHAVRSFFEEGGKRLYIVRVFEGKDNDTGIAKTTFPAGGAQDDSVNISARFPGEAGNVRVSIGLKVGQNILAGRPLESPPGVPIDLLEPRVSALREYDVVWVNDIKAPLFSPSVNPGLFIARRYFNTGKQADSWEFTDPVGSTPTRKLEELQADQDPKQGDQVRVITLTVTVTLPNGTTLTWDNLPPDPRHVLSGSHDSLSDVFAQIPSNLSMARTLPIVISLGKNLKNGLQVVNTLFPGLISQAIGSPLLPPVPLEIIVDLKGGDDGARPTASKYEGEDNPDTGKKTGLKIFEDIEDISILAAPGSTYNYENGWRANANTIINLLISHAERMRYMIAVLDSGNKQTVSQIRAMRARFDSKYAALYYPWIRVLDPVTQAEIYLPPSGSVSGIYARNDIQRAVYKAPANEVVNVALGFELLLNKAQQDVLNPEGINAFRFFEGRGFRLWGARTISSDPEWKYVNLRRYFAYLERSIDRGTQWAVFEPNGEALWANVRRTIEDFLLNEWQSGALLGDKPEKAYFVRCDRSTMTQNDLDNGRLICLIGVAPLRPAEFVIFRIGQWTADRKV